MLYRVLVAVREWEEIDFNHTLKVGGIFNLPLLL